MTQQKERGMKVHIWIGKSRRLLLDSRVVDVTRSYNPIFITISSLKPFLFNDLINEWRFVDRMEA